MAGDLDITWPTISAVRSPALRLFLPGMMFSCHKELRKGSRDEVLSGSQTRHASPVCESVPHWSRTFYRVPSMFQKLLEQTLLEPSH